MGRFCPQCRSEVEDAGGFCLLGHSLRAVAPTDSLAALRAEVDKAFEDARVSVSSTLADLPVPPPPPPATGTAVATHAPPPPLRPRFAIEEPPAGTTDPITDFAPAPRMDWGPERQGFLKGRI